MADIDEAIRVTVSPSQASYFAGEPFAVTVTFTNTRAPQTSPLRSASHSAIHAHKRGAHSISSVPLARPPTSPVTLRAAIPPYPVRSAGGPSSTSRKGLVGRKFLSSGLDPSQPLDPTKKRLVQSKSLSLSIAHDVAEEFHHDIKGKSPVNLLRAAEYISAPPTSPQISSPLARTAALSIAPNHPHARKQSVFDGQLQLQDLRPPASLSPFSATPPASTSSFSLSLDPITESASALPPLTPSLSSPHPSVPMFDPRTQIPTPSAPATKYSYPPRAPAPVRRPSQLGLGHGPPPGSQAPPRPPFSPAFPSPANELILYAYAQLLGTLTLTPLPGMPVQAQAMDSLRARLLRRPAVGGGSMDISANISPTRGHARSASLFSARTPSVISSLFSPPGAGLGLGLEEADAGTPLPTFEVPRAMLAVDLSLGPGESRSYTYMIQLPENLPPTFRGRTLRFGYQFVLGVCRAAGGTAGSSSRVMKVPIRMYNYVSVTRPLSPYDLLWPVAVRQRSTEHLTSVIETRPSAKPEVDIKGQSSFASKAGTYEELKNYARDLLSSFPERDGKGVTFKLPAALVGAEEESGGCRQAVEILTRNPKKMSYDVNKDGVKVAVLTFTKSAYRLGETILGVVELNERTGRARVLKLSAMLEAQESLPTTLGVPTNVRHMRRVHAEQHASFMPATLRTTFSLDIPPDASPAFAVHVGGAPGGTGGLAWVVRLCLLVAVAAPTSRAGADGVMLRQLVRDGPRGEWGTAWTAGSSIAPMERIDTRVQAEQVLVKSKSWAAFFAGAFMGASEVGYHDGDEELDGEEGLDGGGEGEAGPESEWKEVKVEMVECEVPVRVWAGNTAFKAVDVVFDL